MSWHVLFIDTDQVCGDRQRALRQQDITVTVCRDEGSLVASVEGQRFDLVIVAPASGASLPDLRWLGEAFGAATIPTVVLDHLSTALGESVDRFALPVDHWLPFDVEDEEFIPWILCILKRTRYLLELSADTGLPGKTWIDEQLQARIDADREFSCIYFDMDRFKSIVDAYGFVRADAFLRAMAEALRGGADSIGPPRVDLGHIGGDDFLAVCEPAQVLAFTKFTVNAFEHAADSLYDPVDARRGYVEIPNRRWGGKPSRAALVTLSIGVAESTMTGRTLRSPSEVAAVASEMKKVAKSQPGSFVAIDRRRTAAPSQAA